MFPDLRVWYKTMTWNMLFLPSKLCPASLFLVQGFLPLKGFFRSSLVWNSCFCNHLKFFLWTNHQVLIFHVVATLSLSARAWSASTPVWIKCFGVSRAVQLIWCFKGLFALNNNLSPDPLAQLCHCFPQVCFMASIAVWLHSHTLSVNWTQVAFFH